jgi:outer membrane usher protein
MALSRPISDSFVIVAPHKTIRDKNIKVNSYGERYLAQTDFLGSAVLPEVSGYSINSVSIDRNDLPVGYQIEDDAFYFEPTYKRGGVAKIGTDAIVMVKGQLLEGAEKPFSLVSGEILYLDEPEKEPILFFTNRSGFFAAEGLKPGKYKIIVYGDKIFSSFITIPEGTTGLYALGALQVEVLGEDQKMLNERIEE